LIFGAVLTTYYLTSGGHTPYDYFARLADSFLTGRLYLTDNPPWLNELIPINNKFYVAYPPMPAILLMPFKLLFKSSFFQEQLSFLVGASISITYFAISKKITKSLKAALWTTIFVSFGTILWFLSTAGSSWYLGQTCATLFLSLAIFEHITKKRPWVLGIFLGAAFLSRIHLILAIPFFVTDASVKKKFKFLFLFMLGFLPFLVFNFYYNLVRFGTIFDKGYFLIPGLFEEPWYQQGIFNLSYIPRHLKVIFLSLPIVKTSYPFVIPSWGGLAIWITSPAFVYSLFAPLKVGEVKMSWISIILISLVLFSHGTTGFAQFGYRFAVDFYPFLILITIYALHKRGIKWHHWLVLMICILVNAWGVILINKLGWVSL